MFNPLPAIALLPLALLWFGLGAKSLIFVIIHSVLWAVALNTHSGFMSVSPTLRMAGQNCGLRGLSYVALLLVPAAFPSILTGLKIGWAFAWRTLIAAELVFGASSRSGGLGWFIFENRNQLETASVFAGLLTVILIGLVVERGSFRSIENATIRRWGLQSARTMAKTRRCMEVIPSLSRWGGVGCLRSGGRGRGGGGWGGAPPRSRACGSAPSPDLHRYAGAALASRPLPARGERWEQA